MAPKLAQNVEIDGTWYGPDYPAAKVTSEIAERITNPAAWNLPEDDHLDLRFRADDFGVDDGEQPNLREDDDAEAGEGDEAERARLESLSKDELLAEAETRGVEVSASAKKADLVDALLAG